MADTKISAATVLAGTGLISVPAARAGSTTAYRRVDNLSATADPAVGDDSADGFHIGSIWLRSDTGEMWKCLDPAAGAAVWVRMAEGFGAPQMPYYTNTNNYLTTPSGAVGNSAISADRLFMMPVWVPKRRAFTTLATVVAGAGAGGTVARLGLYNANQDTAKPTTLIEEGASTIAVDSTGTKTATIAQTLNAGLYYLAMVSNGAPTMPCAGSNSTTPLGRELAATSASCVVSLSRVFTYGALGDETASTWSNSGGGATSPFIGIR
jgi:hypothetical protein